MPILDILTYPDPRLKKRSTPVEKIDRDIEKLLDDMAETMYDAPGIGLAAPQVGINLRVIIVDISAVEKNSPGLIELINPEIVSVDGEETSEEGCLSIPDFTSKVKRKAWVKVQGLNRKGEPIERETAGLLARAFQHEIDHIDGLLFIDRLSRLKKELIKNKIKKALSNKRED